MPRGCQAHPGMVTSGEGRSSQVVVSDGTPTHRRPHHVQVIVCVAIDHMVDVAWADVADGVAGGVRRPCAGENGRVFVAEPGSAGAPIDIVHVIVVAAVEHDEDYSSALPHK